MFPSVGFSKWYISENFAPGYVLRPHLLPFLSTFQVLTSPCSKLFSWIAQWVLFFTGYSTIGEGDEGTLFIANKQRQSLICYDAIDFFKKNPSCINEWSICYSFILWLFKMWEKSNLIVFLLSLFSFACINIWIG